MDRNAKVMAPPLRAASENPPLPDNATLLQAIQSSKEALEGRIAEVRSDVTLL